MLARLQRRLLAGLVLTMLIIAVGATAIGRPDIGALLALLLASGYTLVLACEFVLMACAHGDDPTPRAGLLTLLCAWGSECVVALWVFCWLQPFRERAQPDVPGLKGRRGIVFVHGYLCNRAIWNPWLRHCARRGIPSIALNLEPVFGDLSTYGVQVEHAVARLERETGLAPLLVCHSMGGLVARAWLMNTHNAGRRVHHVVTIGTPHQGTWLACLGVSVNACLMRPGNAWLTALSDAEPLKRAKLFTCFYGHADNIVFPPLSATLSGADNRHLSATPHVAMAYHPAVMVEVLRRLDGAA